MSRTSSVLTWAALLAALLICPPAPAAEPHDPVAAGELPQYIFFNKTPHAAGPLRWHQSRPDLFTVESMRQIAEHFGTAGNDKLRVGASFIFSMLENETELLTRSLSAMLEAAQQADVPVLITLDGQNWWQHRPDLWNWWDPSLPGFDPSNRMNVEWTGWGPEYATKIAWRNWGRQLRIRPAQNIFAPRVQKELHDKLADCVRVIAAWQRELPKDKRYLFGGVKLGWEASINVNAYYYENGNEIFEQYPTDTSKDPDARDLEKGFTFGSVPMGYAAATAIGLKDKGELTIGDHENMVHKYLADLCRTARREGLPAHMIFTHQGGTYAPWDKHLSFKPAINGDSIPGWSFYSHDPPDCGSLGADLESAGRRQWAASEWWRGADSAEKWRRNFERTLSFKQCRLVTVYNWEPFTRSSEGAQAVRALIEAPKSAGG